jgi:hypothetical protein
MVNSEDTLAPAIILCPCYHSAYNQTKLHMFGIANAEEYKSETWKGNSTMDEKLVYKSVTYGLENLLEKLEIQLISGSTKMFIGQNISSLNTHVYSTRFVGRCFEIDIRQFAEIPSAVVMTTKLHIYIYINLHGQFSNADSKSKVEVKIRNTLFIEVTYEVLKINFEKSCRIIHTDPSNLRYEQKGDSLICTKPNCLVSLISQARMVQLNYCFLR